MIAYRRYTDEESICCLFNFSGEEREEILPSENGTPLWGNLDHVSVDGNKIRLQPYQAVLIKEKM